jgi:cytosine deaminase
MGIAARAKVNFITNPFGNSVLQNRTDGYPRRRGHTRVDELDAAGVNVCIGHDNLMDPWYPMGTGSVLKAANLLMHTAHMSGPKQVYRLFNMITDNAAVTMQVQDRYGIEAGKPANLLVLDAVDELDAIRRMPVCLYVIRNGMVALRSKPAERRLAFAGYDRVIDFKLPR